MFSKQKALALGLLGLTASMHVAAVFARDDIKRMSIESALAAPDAKAMLNKGIQFYFGDMAHPEAASSFGVFTSSKKANGFGKADVPACERAFLSAMLSFQDRALREGGDAVVKLTSYYRHNSVNSSTEYECGTGATMVGVAFQGEVVKLKK
jgi:hypothetical protein